ncbi:Bug family tripartite tricarboxylate transporter substrate binding protein [Hydrogenophaga pseudoflava]|uniref:Bug family tripartite tricarboxylate transporter substrate binding protein n=1 Tax=Hydrogenophaga pseudoflava TaxID=47421 RepID=UPI0027E57FF0|nr:tripartite tricarboxylate transporter substrate binding protein [Hydrogenophaga pseudoflava]MDQ7743088.1 tripartite tricarboxylate transporter substrate binding protein [Hydrogenophaga pseudoflava]
MSALRTLLVIAAALAPLGPSHAQAPAADLSAARSVRMVVPLPAGGPSDFIARLAAQHLSEALGQPVVVENKPGANGLIAAREVAATGGDGQVVLYAPGSMIATPLLARDPGFDWTRELAPLGKIGRVPFGLAVHPGVPATSVAELATLARQQPGALNVATSTPSEVMAAAQFMKAARATLTRVPYKGAQQAMPDLLAGRVQLMFGPLSALQPQVRSGALRLLAVLGSERSAAWPDVPTLGEAGFPGVAVPTWQALYVPVRVDGARQARLAQAVQAVAARPDVQAELGRRLLAAEAASPQELSATIRHELADWAALIDEYRLTAD